MLAVLFAAVVGYGAYNLGVSHGLAVNPILTTAAAPAPGAAPIFVYPYGWHRPWGGGLFFPFLAVAFWLVVARAFFRGGPWRHRGCRGAGPEDLPPIFDQWHRRAHERMKSEPSAQ
jgi:hypothetical protein